MLFARQKGPCTFLRWALALVIACLPLLAVPATGPNAGRTLRVVMDQDYPPYSFRAPDGSLKGILPEEWGLWERKTGIKVQLDAMDWAQAQRRMAAGDYDVIDTLFSTEPRRALYDFGPPYARIDVPIFFRRDLAGIGGPADLAGFVVGAKRGDSSIDILKMNGVNNFRLFDNYEDLVAAARDGKVQIFTVDQPPALYYLIKMGIEDRFRASEPLYSGDFHRAVRKGDKALLTTVQLGFEAITPGEHQRIQRRWFGRPVISRRDLRDVALIAGGALCLLAIMLAWIGVLRRMVRRRTEDLRASELVTRTISSNFTNGMIYQARVEPDGGRHFTFLSDSVSLLYGVSPAEAMADASRIYGRIHPEDLPALVRLEDEAIRTGSTFKAETRVVGPDGLIRWSSFVSTPRLLPSGATLWDGLEFIITDRKQGEEALRESEANYRSLVSAIPDLVFTFSRSGDYQTVHAFAPALLVAPDTDLVGRNVDQVLPAPLAAQMRQAILLTLETGEVRSLDYTLVLGGEPKAFEARLAPSGKDQVIVVARDVSESRRMEERQRLLQASLEQAQKLDSLGSLAGGVAHDMNNVLGAILAMASIQLENQVPGSPMHRALDTICKAATRGGRMVKGLLNFARQTAIVFEEVDLNAIVADVTQLLERTTLSRVRLVLELHPGLAPIRGDGNALAHAFMNLCVNAVDAMAGDGTLTLRTRNLEPGQVEATVEDTGAGMTPEVLQKAINPFFTTKAQGKGTGLGLSMVYGTAKSHGGDLDIRSEPGQGTKVTLRFPVAPAAHGPSRDEGPPRPSDGGQRLQVLVVDDDEFVRGAIAEVLGSQGHATTAVSSGEEALARLEAGFRPDAVILDMNMPGLGGAGTLPRLRILCPETPVLLVTGKADPEALGLVANHGSVTLLPKPFSAEAFRVQLGQLLSR